MATQELYIRNATDTEARGPFSVEQLVSLAESSQVTAETLIYDATAEQWVALGTNAELMSAIFPEKKKLTLKAKEISTLNKSDEQTKAITVDDMLAAAEGRTEETADRRDPEIAMMQAARIGLWSALAALVLAAAGAILPNTSTLLSFDAGKIIAQPIIFLGILDVVLAVLLGLGMTSLYPFVRFRAALGFGFLGFIFYAQGLSMPFLFAALGSAGLYLCTVFVSVTPVIIAAAAALVGMGGLAWHFLSQ